MFILIALRLPLSADNDLDAFFIMPHHKKKTDLARVRNFGAAKMDQS